MNALAPPAALTSLAAGYNSLGQNAARALAEASTRSASLTELDISGNLIGLKGGKAICEAVVANARVEHVDLRFNSFDSRTRDLLKETQNMRSGLKVEV